MLSRIIDDSFQVLRPFSLKDENGILVAISRDLNTNTEVVVKAAGGKTRKEDLRKEAANNELLDKDAPETTKMLFFKEA